MAGGSSTKVVQITNIAPQATKDQMHALFGIIGKVEEIRLCKLYLRVVYCIHSNTRVKLSLSNDFKAL